MPLLPKNFRFSPLITVIAIALACSMLWASSWQWERYQFKTKLVETFKAHSDVAPLDFPTDGQYAKDFEGVLNQKVKLSGEYDFSREMIVMNRKHATGPGFWLLTPLKIEGSDKHLIVSRGFIPYADRTPESWEKYQFSAQEELMAVVQADVPHRAALSPKNPDVGGENPFVRKWLYPDLSNIAKQLPYPVITDIFVQRVGGPPEGTFPAESISIRVPPSTHFGYTFEWILLAIGTLTLGFLLQAFPRKKNEKAPGSRPQAPAERSL